MSYLGNDSGWSWSKTGWQITSSKKKYIHNYSHENPHYDDISNKLTNISWASQNVWDGKDYVIVFKNQTKNSMKIKNVKIKMVSCNSNKQQFYASTSGGIALVAAANGAPARYTCIIRTFKSHAKLKANSPADTEKTAWHDIPQNSSCNMKSRGAAGKATAVFTFNKNADTRTFTFESDPPTIGPKGVAAIHIRVSNFGSSTFPGVAYIKFDLQGTAVEIEEEGENYIWQFQADGKWHLIRPAYIKESDGFKPLEEVKHP